MLRVGIAGLGFMGMIHYLSYQKVRGAKVAAICEQTRKRLSGDWRDIKGNFGPAGEQMDLSGIATYDDLDAMLENPEIDMVDITLPPALHADIACKALRKGKHVFCEKPMALKLSDCSRMIAAAQKAKRQLLVGHVLPLLPEYAWARKVIDDGRYGKLLGGSFRRVISDPAWLKHYWKAEVVGGPMLDLHIHDAHLIRLLFGMPIAVSTTGRSRGQLAEYWSTQFRFKKNLAVTATSGTIDQQGRPFDHGFEIHLEKATLLFQFAVIGDDGKYLCPPTLLDHRGKTKPAKMPAGDPMMNAFQAELKAVTESVRAGKKHPLLGGDFARDAIAICQAETKSLLQKKTITIK
jgi:predicted dehydrogenase